MGNQNCTEIYQHYRQNQAYGDFQILKQNNKSIALVEKSLQNDNKLKQQVELKLETRLKLKSNHLSNYRFKQVKLQKYFIIQNKYSTQVKMYYQYINKTLQDKYQQIISKKQKQASSFTQRQLFNIIYGVQSALHQLNSYQICHGCINLSTILCQGNFYKITDVSSTTFVKSYDLARRGCRSQFLSEKLLTNLQYRSLEPYYDIEDDLFSLGMIILALILKVDSKYFYNWKQKTCTAQLRWDNINVGLKSLQKLYSSKLSKKVKQLIGYERQQQKSFLTNQTTINMNSNSGKQNSFSRTKYTKSLSKQNQINRSKNDNKSVLLNSCSNQNIKYLNQEVDFLDKQIDKILSRVNTSHTSNHKIVELDDKIKNINSDLVSSVRINQFKK